MQLQVRSQDFSSNGDAVSSGATFGWGAWRFKILHWVAPSPVGKRAADAQNVGLYTSISA